MKIPYKSVRLAVALVIAFFATPSTADNFIDFFTTGLDTYYWEVISNQPLYTVDNSQSDIRISKPVGGTYEFQTAHIGVYSVYWNGKKQFDTKVPSGIYFARLSSNSDVAKQKIIFLK